MEIRRDYTKSEKRPISSFPQNPKKPQKLDLALLLYQPLISHFKIDFLSEAAGFRAKKVPFFVGGVKSA